MTDTCASFTCVLSVFSGLNRNAAACCTRSWTKRYTAAEEVRWTGGEGSSTLAMGAFTSTISPESAPGFIMLTSAFDIKNPPLDAVLASRDNTNIQLTHLTAG